MLTADAILFAHYRRALHRVLAASGCPGPPPTAGGDLSSWTRIAEGDGWLPGAEGLRIRELEAKVRHYARRGHP